MMTDQKCKHADSCAWWGYEPEPKPPAPDSDNKPPFYGISPNHCDTGGGDVSCIPVEPAPQPEMMICPDAQGCKSRHCERNRFITSHAKPHAKNEYCKSCGDCPACIAVEKAAPEPPAPDSDNKPPFYGIYPGVVRPFEPLDLDAIRERVERNGWRNVSSIPDIRPMIAEIERLRDRLEMADGRVTRLNRMLGITAEERDALDLRLSASRRLVRSYISLWRRAQEPHDETEQRLERAGEQVARLNQRLGIAIEQRDEASEQLDEMRDWYWKAVGERDDARAVLVEWYRIAESRLRQNDELRRELEVMTRANEQLGGLVREAQAGSVMVGGEVAE